jgi:putative endonuclease
LIGLEHGTLTFIEVKTRSAEDFGSPFEAVSIAKQRRIERAAQFYLVRQRLSGKDARFDVVGVWWQDGQVRCELIRNAFEPRRWSGA